MVYAKEEHIIVKILSISKSDGNPLVMETNVFIEDFPYFLVLAIAEKFGFNLTFIASDMINQSKSPYGQQYKPCASISSLLHPNRLLNLLYSTKHNNILEMNSYPSQKIYQSSIS